jgi:hypothetical protein
MATRKQVVLGMMLKYAGITGIPYKIGNLYRGIKKYSGLMA